MSPLESFIASMFILLFIFSSILAHTFKSIFIDIPALLTVSAFICLDGASSSSSSNSVVFLDGFLPDNSFSTSSANSSISKSFSASLAASRIAGKDILSLKVGLIKCIPSKICNISFPLSCILYPSYFSLII